MEFDVLVANRRSIRDFAEGVEIPREDIEQMIECALEAPTWKNTETGRYYVVNTPDMVEKVRAEALPEFNQNSTRDAAAYVVTTFEAERSGFERDGNPTNELGNEWGAYDLGLQNENLILRARDMSLDTLIMGIRDGEKLREKLSIPESQRVVSVISVGVRASDPEMPKRKAVDDVAKFF